MAQVHEYKVSVQWQGGRSGAGKFTAEHSGVSGNLAVPAEFGGPGTAASTNPEELLTSAIASCFSITFGIIADNQKLAYESLQTIAIGEVEQNGMQFKFTKVTIKPQITLPSGSDESMVQKANDIAHKADAYCIITNAVRANVEIAVEPTVSVN